MSHYIYNEIGDCGYGIGHRLLNYMDSLYYSTTLNIPHVYSGFPKEKRKNIYGIDKYDDLHNIEWEDFFTFGCNETTIDDLLERGYSIIDIPEQYDLNNNTIEQHKEFINNYNGQNIIFKGHDIWRNNIEAVNIFKQKYWSSPHRDITKTTYTSDFINISVQIRRGTYMLFEPGTLIHSRILPIEYFIQAIDNTLKHKFNKEILLHIYIEQGLDDDLNLFKKYNNILIKQYNHTGMKQVFTDFANSDIIIGSESGFTHIMSLLTDCIKIIPDSQVTDEMGNYNNIISTNRDNGTFNDDKLENLIKTHNL